MLAAHRHILKLQISSRIGIGHHTANTIDQFLPPPPKLEFTGHGLMDTLHCNAMHYTAMHRRTSIDLSCIVMYQTQLIASSSKNLLSSGIRLNTFKTLRNFTSCLYIPSPVPNTCTHTHTNKQTTGGPGILNSHREKNL